MLKIFKDDCIKHIKILFIRGQHPCTWNRTWTPEIKCKANQELDHCAVGMEVLCLTPVE